MSGVGLFGLAPNLRLICAAFTGLNLINLSRCQAPTRTDRPVGDFQCLIIYSFCISPNRLPHPKHPHLPLATHFSTLPRKHSPHCSICNFIAFIYLLFRAHFLYEFCFVCVLFASLYLCGCMLVFASLKFTQFQLMAFNYLSGILHIVFAQFPTAAVNFAFLWHVGKYAL